MADRAPRVPGPPPPPRPARLADPVIYDLCDKIVGGTLRVSEPLPPEPELCAFYGVSRTVIREALQSLQKVGLVHVRQGQQTTVQGDEQWNLLDPVLLAATVRHDADSAILDHLVEVRVALEAQMAARAAVTATPAQLERLSSMLETLETAIDDPEKYFVLDGEFHDIFMIASGNRLARVVVRAIHEQARGNTRYGSTVVRAEMLRAQRGHAAICRAITAGNPQEAADAVRDHILGSWNRKSKQSDVVLVSEVGATKPRKAGAKKRSAARSSAAE